jgi:tetratricopeptide (TPR) repeat protein
MTNDLKDNLFILIKSLTKSEKRQFKLYVGRMDSNENSKYLSLFNLMEKMKEYKESIILSKGIVTKQQLSNLKAHLYKQILISLRLNPVHKNIRIQIRQQLDFATILYQKGLYKQSLKFLEKVKILALKHEEKYIAYDIVELEKVIESQYITRSLSNRVEELIKQSDQLCAQNNLATQLSNLSLQLYEKLIKAGYAKSDDEYRKITQFFYKKMSKINYDDLGFREKLWFYMAHVWYSFLTQDFLSSYKYSLKWIKMFEEFPQMIYVHPVFYLRGNNYLMESLNLIKHPVKFKRTLNQMIITIESEDFPKNDNISAITFQYQYSNLVNLCFLEGNFNEALLSIPNILEGIRKFENQIDAHHVMMFYYKIACIYFGKEDYENCIAYLDKIIKNKNLKMREDLLCYSRVLNIFAHYEAGFDYHLENQLRDTYKFLLKMNDLHEVQKAMIRFVRKLGEIFPHELKTAFKKLYDELKVFENDPYEKRSFLYLDILSWLESKIENKPIVEVIKKKAVQFNRKERPSISPVSVSKQ